MATETQGIIKRHNKPRAKRIEKIIKAVNYEAGETAVRDILADLRHYCDANDINFAEQDRMARQHYNHERQFAD